MSWWPPLYDVFTPLFAVQIKAKDVYDMTRKQKLLRK